MSPKHKAEKRLSSQPQKWRPNTPHLHMLIHDMNNSLMVLGLTAERLATLLKARKVLLQDGKASSNDIDKQHDMLRQNIHHIREMLCELSDKLPPEPKCCQVTRSDNGKGEQQDILLDYDGLVRFIADQQVTWKLIALPQTQIQCDIAPFHGTVPLNPAYLARLFDNLVRNACEAYHSRDERDGYCHLCLTVQAEERIMRFVFSDNGPGIDEADAARIFAPFETKKGAARLPRGLGLASARTLAQQMGGDLFLDRKVAKGARFVLTLPMASSVR